MSQRGEAFSWRDTALGIDSPGQQPEIAGPDLWGELPNPALIPADFSFKLGTIISPPFL